MAAPPSSPARARCSPSQGTHRPEDEIREEELFRDAGIISGGIPTTRKRLKCLRELCGALVHVGRAALLYVIVDDDAYGPPADVATQVARYWPLPLPRPRLLTSLPPRPGVPAWEARVIATGAAMVDVRELALVREVDSFDPGWTGAPLLDRALARRLNAACGVHFVPYASSGLGLTRGDAVNLTRILNYGERVETQTAEEWPARDDEDPF